MIEGMCKPTRAKVVRCDFCEKPINLKSIRVIDMLGLRRFKSCPKCAKRLEAANYFIEHIGDYI
jgi:hypothetical protein